MGYGCRNLVFRPLKLQSKRHIYRNVNGFNENLSVTNRSNGEVEW